MYGADAESHLAELAHHFAAAAPAGTAGKAVEYATPRGRPGVRPARVRGGRSPLRDGAGLVTDERGALRAAARARRRPGAGGRHAGLEGVVPRRRRDRRIASDSDSSSPARRWATAAGSSGRSPATTRTSCRCSSGVSRSSATTIPGSAYACWPGWRAALSGRRGSPDRRVALSAEALDLARAAGDPSTIAYALSGYLAAHHSPDHTSAQLELATEQIETGMGAGDLERAAEGYEHRVTARLELGDAAGARADLAEMAGLASRLRQPSQDWFVAVYGALLAFFEGNLAEAESLMERGAPHRRACTELERRGVVAPPAVRAAARAGSARRARGAGPPLARRVPHLSDLGLRPGADGRRSRPGGRGA